MILKSSKRKGGIDMLTLLFICLLIWVVAKLLWWAVKASWAITKTLLACVVLPIVLIALFALDLVIIAIPALILIGLVSMVARPA